MIPGYADISSRASGSAFWLSTPSRRSVTCRSRSHVSPRPSSALPLIPSARLFIHVTCIADLRNPPFIRTHRVASSSCKSRRLHPPSCQTGRITALFIPIYIFIYIFTYYRGIHIHVHILPRHTTVLAIRSPTHYRPGDSIQPECTRSNGLLQPVSPGPQRHRADPME
jgi:hypothetical protein